MTTTGQTINDRLNAVRYALVGQGLARTVCKATTEEVLGPKKKHIDYLLACTNEPNVSIPQLANLLIERTQHTSWAVVFKSLISIHHLMSYGNERFTQYLATSNHSFELGDFMDRTTPQGYNMSTFVRRYAKYINDKSISYRTLAIDLCKIRGGNDNALRTMNMDNLGKTLPIVQTQFDSLLEFGADAKDLNNGIIMSAFKLLYKDLVKLFVAYQEAIINLLERYFKLSRKKTREALSMYKKYLERMEKVDSFLRVVETVGLDKSEMPDLKKSPASILEILEKHLAQLEAKKRGATPASPDGADEEENNNNENEPPTSTTTGSASDTKGSSDEKGGPSSAADEAHEAHKAQQSAGIDSNASTPASDSKQQPAPPKKPPARPSPIVSPKASPSSPGTSDKKAAPPERPVKPPSRPPPPSSSSGAGSSEKGPTTTSNKKEKAAPASAKTPSPVPPPPPPPVPAAPNQHVSTQPPTASNEPASNEPATTTTTTSTTTGHVDEQEVLPDTTGQPQPDGTPPHEPEEGGNDATGSPRGCCSVTVTSCSATINEASDQLAPAANEDASHQEDPSNEQRMSPSSVNHVNNINNNNNNHHLPNIGPDDEMPSPPPPIEDDVEADDGQEQPAGQNDGNLEQVDVGAAPGEPIEHQGAESPAEASRVNGQSNNVVVERQQ